MMPAQELAGSPNLGLELTIRRRTRNSLVRFVIPDHASDPAAST